MYVPYLSGGYAAALLLLVIGIRVIRRSAPDLRGARHVHRFIVCVLLALGFLSLHQWAPLLSAAGTNVLTFAGGIFLYLATAEVQETRPRLLPLQIALCAVALPVQVWLALVHSSVEERLLVHCMVMAALFAMSATLLCRRGDAALESSRRAAAVAFTLFAGDQVLWGIAGVLHPPGRDLLRADNLETGLSYLTVVLACASIAALMWLSLCAHRRDLHQIAHTDSLTGLLNRRAFEEILRRELPRCHRVGRQMGAMLIDIDHFKQINDSLGHRAGDDALRSVSEALREHTRLSDVLARYGGEEFVVLLRNATPEEVERVAERVRGGIAALQGLPGRTRLTVSIGVAISYPRETAEDFLLRCDEAMYGAKRGGRNLVMVSRTSGSEPIVAM